MFLPKECQQKQCLTASAIRKIILIVLLLCSKMKNMKKTLSVTKAVDSKFLVTAQPLAGFWVGERYWCCDGVSPDLFTCFLWFVGVNRNRPLLNHWVEEGRGITSVVRQHCAAAGRNHYLTIPVTNALSSFAQLHPHISNIKMSFI